MKLIYCAKRWLTQPTVVRDLRSSSCPRSLPVMFPSASALSQRCSANVAHWLPQKKKKSKKKKHTFCSLRNARPSEIKIPFHFCLKSLLPILNAMNYSTLYDFYFIFFIHKIRIREIGRWQACLLRPSAEIRLCWVASNWVLNISPDGDSTTWPLNPFHCWITPWGEKSTCLRKLPIF